MRQIRHERDLSLYGLAKLTGLSKSYLNEIEKGKKYPKTDKIALLSQHLNIPYDQMVSLKLDKNLAPLGEILQSKILKEILNFNSENQLDIQKLLKKIPSITFKLYPAKVIGYYQVNLNWAVPDVQKIKKFIKKLEL